MKKIVKSICLCILLVCVAISMSVCAKDTIEVIIDGERIDFDVEPQIIDSRTMVPMRAVFEALGADVEWDGDIQTVYAYKDNTEISLSIGSKKIYINDKRKTMDIAPVIIGGRTLVPVRFIAEAFDCEVEWISESSTVDIRTYYTDETEYNGLPQDIIDEQEE